MHLIDIHEKSNIFWFKIMLVYTIFNVDTHNLCYFSYVCS